MEVYKEFTFEAAHSLPNVPTGHKCAGIHGHSFRVRIYVTGPVCPRMGWVVDFADIKRAFAPLMALLDHSDLNGILENPTSENLAVWIWDRLQLEGLSAVELSETASSGCIHRA